MIAGFSLHFESVKRHLLSTALNLLVSAGNYFIISGESNIGCKYIH
jgi:hypothetical protein